jgi:NAD(P)-dependent dehydrogenase (short-subunit alcohol dehydrogenase family)
VGQQVCRELAAQGAEVVATVLHGTDAAEALRALPGCTVHVLDLRDTEALRRVVGGAGPLQALVHCAARTSAGPKDGFDTIEDPTPAGWADLFAVNVESAFFAVQAAAPQMRDGGNVVLLGSIDGVKGLPSPAAYAASKGALSALARSLGKELGPANVRVNVVAPGILEAGASRKIPGSLRAEYIKHGCAHRFGTLQEAAQVVAFFALENTYVTGQTICLDGGI